MQSLSVPIHPHSQLREGYTTGTCATAALIFAMELMFTNKVSESLPIPLPPFPDFNTSFSFSGHKLKWLTLSPSKVGIGPASVYDLALLHEQNLKNSPSSSTLISHAALIKDGGDDPDITHGLPIYVTLAAFPNERLSCPLPYSTDFLKIIAGEGVGIVTKPGLPIPQGEAAINPAPRRQLLFAASFYFNKFIRKLVTHRTIQPPFTIIISVPGGEHIASQTLNPKLGIQGGISILGTRGIVRPFSNKAWQESIRQEISVARASGLDTICLSTGRRSEELLKNLYSLLPQAAFIQVGDIAAQALSFVALAGFKHIVWGCYFGKLCKLAQGMPNTHAYKDRLDLNLIYDICRSENAISAEKILSCNTAREALELILLEDRSEFILKKLMLLAKQKLEKYAGKTVILHLFHDDGTEIMRL